MLTFKDQELAGKLEAGTHASPVAPSRFYSFTDVENNVRQQIQRVKTHPWIPKQIPVRGFVYDVKSGSLREVSAATAARAQTA